MVGSLLLGLFDAEGVFHHVGVASGFSVARRQEFVDTLGPYRESALEHHPWHLEGGPDGRVPGGQSRWNAGKDLTWEPLRPERVAEVRYEHVLSGRFRHGGRLVRILVQQAIARPVD